MDAFVFIVNQGDKCTEKNLKNVGVDFGSSYGAYALFELIVEN